jgi:uncharacterized protein (TIGR02001 family)
MMTSERHRATARKLNARTTRDIAALLLGVLAAHSVCAAETWGGSVGLTSDYLVRGLSRSDNKYAIQADLHVASDLGIIGGVFASTSRFSSDDHRDVELSAFLGFAWTAGSDWRAKVLVSHYSYPWNAAGSQYNYDEFSVDANFRDWLDVNVMYSPNSPIPVDYSRLMAVTEKAAEINFHTPWWHRFAAAAGAGYADLSGPSGLGYAYWSAGGLYDASPWSFSLSYVNTSAAAKYLFYNAAAHDRWAATVIWQF